MSVISTTLCYPHSEAPTQGIFVQRRLQAIAGHLPITVIAPVPWFPLLAPMPSAAPMVVKETPSVTRPRMFYLPGIAKSFDAGFYAIALERAIRSLDPRDRPIRLIDAHFEWPDGVGAFRVARRLGIPFVCTLRGKLVSQIGYSSRRRQIVEMLCGADRLIAVSHSLAELTRRVAGDDLRVSVIPNGIDREIFTRYIDGQSASSPSPAARAELGWSSTTKYAVSVGHLQSLKGFHLLVDMWPRVRKRVGDARLMLVGGSAGERGYERQLRRQIEALGLTEDVTLAGRAAPQRVARMLNAADLFVLASRSEGWCNAIAEALACGCPVVASDVGGNREIMNEWGLGRLVPLDNPGALLDRTCDGLEEEWDRGHIAEVGGRRDWQQVAAECVDVFREIMHD